MAIMNTDFVYLVPNTLEEATKALQEYGARAKIIAGGTDLIPKMKANVVQPEYLVSLKKLTELDFITYDEENGLRFGAGTTLRKLEAFPAVREKYPVLYQGMHSMASTQIRNAGTVVGNICNAVPSADTAPALLVLGACVKIVSCRGERLVPVSEFFTGVCRTVVQPEEIVTEVRIPAPGKGYQAEYYKYTIRKALDLAMVGVAVNGLVEDGICKDIRIALGAVAVTPRLAVKAQELLAGKQLTEELVEEAARVASQEDCAPITDIRATAAYRREMVRLLTRDGLKKLAGLA